MNNYTMNGITYPVALETYTAEQAPYVYTVKGERHAHGLNLEPRNAGTVAMFAGDPLGNDSIGKLWRNRGYVVDREKLEEIAQEYGEDRCTVYQAARKLYALDLIPECDENAARRLLAPIIVDRSSYKPGTTYTAFGCTWTIDAVYEVPDEEIEAYHLWYRWRYLSSVTEKGADYKGPETMDAAIACDWARSENIL